MNVAWFNGVLGKCTRDGGSLWALAKDSGLCSSYEPSVEAPTETERKLRGQAPTEYYTVEASVDAPTEKQTEASSGKTNPSKIPQFFFTLTGSFSCVD